MPLEDKRVPEVTWPVAEVCFCGLEAGGLAELGRGRRAYKNGQHVPRKELVPCPSSKEGPSSESTHPFLAFSFTTRSAVRSFLSSQWPSWRIRTPKQHQAQYQYRYLPRTRSTAERAHHQYRRLGYPYPRQDFILDPASRRLSPTRPGSRGFFWLQPGSFRSRESSSTRLQLRRSQNN